MIVVCSAADLQGLSAANGIVNTVKKWFPTQTDCMQVVKGLESCIRAWCEQEQKKTIPAQICFYLSIVNVV